jgi:hypothetical protein
VADGEAEVEEIHFAYMSGLVVVPMDELDVTQPFLEEMGIEQTVPLDEVLGSIDDGEAEEEVVAARSLLGELIQVYTVGGADPFGIAQEIRAMAGEGLELHIAPIHAIGEAAHSGYQAGTDPDPLQESIDPPSEAPETADLAAVVDSGIYPNTPGLGGNLESHPIDEEPASQDGHSHGTFVSSIIRQLSPEHRITFARAREVPLGDFAWSDGAVGTTGLTTLSTEIHVAEAILRLVHRHQNEAGQVRSLNLSLGGYSTTVGEDLWMTTTSLAIDRWLQTFRGTPVFAAAGNASVTQTFWPAALESVTGVAALNDPASGSPVEIVWDQNHNEVPWASLSSTPRPSTNELAPGSMLVNYTQPEMIACWSGSSFATAVANGLHLRGEASLLNPQNPPHRADVAQLTYWDGTKVLP